VAHSFEELLDPRFKGKINVESRMKMFITLTPAWGEERVVDYLQKLGRQNPTFTKGTTYTLTLLGAGEFPVGVGLSIHGMLKIKRRGAPLAMMPISPLADKLSPHVVMTDAPHPNAAKLFTHWIISKEGQLFMDKVRRKGSPLPGAGTSQSKLVEKMGLDVVTAVTWDMNFGGLQEKYEKAIGFTKSKLKTKKKKKK
jgi:iron(III) transport system substrate-binding protein